MTTPQTDRSLPPIPPPSCDWRDLTWYPVRTRPQCEGRATGHLREAGYEVFYPTRREWTQRRRVGPIARTWQETERPLWVGYILVGLHHGQGLYGLRDADGVHGVLLMDGRPITIVAAKVCDVYARVVAGEWDEDRRPKRRRFRRGDSIRITDGPLAGMRAIVRKDTREDPREVWAELTGIGKKVRLSPDIVRAVEKGLDEALTASVG